MSATRQVFCKGCKRTAWVPAPEAEGHPYGWYYLTVNVPPWFNTDTRRAYRPVGLFCSAACLESEMPSIRASEELHSQAYEHE